MSLVMSESKLLSENFPAPPTSRSTSSPPDDPDTQPHPPDRTETPDKSRPSFLDTFDRDLPSHRRTSSRGLDLSKPPSTSPSQEDNGLDLSKPELLSPNPFLRTSEPAPFANGIPSDTPPTPASGSYGPGRSHNAGDAISPFRADPVPKEFSPDNLTNGGDFKSTFLDSFCKLDPASSRFSEAYSSKAFDPAASSPNFRPPNSSPSFGKMSDPYLTAKLGDPSSFPSPHDPFNKIMEDFGGGVKNNNNNLSGSKLKSDYSDICDKLGDSSYKKITESYVKQIESLANGYKSESSIFKHEDSLSPEGFKSEPPIFGNQTKSESNLTNGIGYGSKTDSVSSSSQPSNQSLPSIINFSPNHLRGMAAVENGLASYLNSYGMGGVGPERGEIRNGGSGGRDGQNGSNASDSSMSRNSPNNKLACRFCGKTFSQAGYIKAHERLHTGEKPFACSVCGKRFSDPSNWKKHERVHANNKKPGHLLDAPEPKVCGRTFAQSGSYRMHERRHITDSIQRCHICYSTFNSWQELQRHMASHPQVTQAILEFEEGNQGLLGRAGDMGGQLGDGGLGPLGQPDMDGPGGHGHLMLPGESSSQRDQGVYWFPGELGSQRDLGVHHGRCPPPPLIPESLLLESEAAAFHVQPQGLYHSPGQLPPFSSILPFRHHPGAPPAFPPSFPPGLGLLGPQSLPVSSHADLLAKHSFFGAMMGASQMKHDALSKLSPSYSPQQHHLLHQPPHPRPELQHLPLLQQQSEHQASDGTDVVSTTSASKRPDLEPRNCSRSYTPEERSDTETAAHSKDNKERSDFARSVSSDEGQPSSDENQMETNGEDEGVGHELADNDNEDEETDVDERSYTSERSYSNMRRFREDEDRRETDRDRNRERATCRDRKRSGSCDDELDKHHFKRDRKSSAEGNAKSNNSSRGRENEYADHDRKPSHGSDRGGGYGQSKGILASRSNINRYISHLSELSSRDKSDKSSSLSGSNSAGGDRGSKDNSDLRPPRRHIERQNLNTRMIPSSSSRKQRHPMRRFSSAGSEHESPQSTSSLPVSSTTAEAIERGDLDDGDLVTFLLTKGRVHKCVHCHMIFEDASLFLLHNGFHSHNDPFKCVVCGNACKDRVDFNCHLTSHIK